VRGGGGKRRESLKNHKSQKGYVHLRFSTCERFHRRRPHPRPSCEISLHRLCVKLKGAKNDRRAWSSSKYEKVEGADECIPAEASSSSSSSVFAAKANEEWGGGKETGIIKKPQIPKRLRAPALFDL
jgi:hypothetical protein